MVPPAMAVYTLRPKKNGKPKSKLFDSELTPAHVAEGCERRVVLNSVSALAIVKLTVDWVPFTPWLRALRFCVEPGHKNPDSLGSVHWAIEPSGQVNEVRAGCR